MILDSIKIKNFKAVRDSGVVKLGALAGSGFQTKHVYPERAVKEAIAPQWWCWPAR